MGPRLVSRILNFFDRAEVIGLNYSEFRESLQWNIKGDYLFRDGMDHYDMEIPRFQRALKALGPLKGKTICDLGSFPGYGLWAFKDCKQYIGLGKSPEWYKEALVSKFNAVWLDCDFEDPTSLPTPPCEPDIVIFQEVLEHIRRPKALLTALHAWMPIGSKLYLTTNNIHYIGYILKLIAGRDIFDPAMTEDSVYPGHCTYYSLKGLASFLTEIGFTILSADLFNFLPESRFYRHRAFAMVKNQLTRSATTKHATHLEILCQKC